MTAPTPGLRRKIDTMSRFTAWLSNEERNGIHQMASEFGSSDNYIVRLAIRAALGLSLPPGLQFPPEERGTGAEGQPS